MALEIAVLDRLKNLFLNFLLSSYMYDDLIASWYQCVSL